MWIKTMKLGYLNTDFIEKIRVRPVEDKFGEPSTRNLYNVTADTKDMFYFLTEGVSKERAEELLQIIMRHIADDDPEFHHSPYEPPTE